MSEQDKRKQKKIDSQLKFGANLDKLMPKMNYGIDFEKIVPQLKFGANLDKLIPKMNYGIDFEKIAPQLKFGANLDKLIPKMNYGPDFEKIAPRLIFGANFDKHIPNMNYGIDFEKIAPKLKMGATFDNLISDTLIPRISTTQLIINKLSSSTFSQLANSLVNLKHLDNSFLEKYQEIMQEEPKEVSELEFDEMDEQEIVNYIKEVISHNFTEGSSVSMEIRIKNFFSEIFSKHPIIKFIILYFLIPWFISCSLSNPGPKEINIQNNSTQIVNYVKKEVKINIHKSEYNMVRIVSKNQLVVKEIQRWDSRTIDRLSLGQVVLVKMKRKNWINIIYFDSNSEEYLSGWTLTRYLDKVR